LPAIFLKKKIPSITSMGQGKYYSVYGLAPLSIQCREVRTRCSGDPQAFSWRGSVFGCGQFTLRRDDGRAAFALAEVFAMTRFMSPYFRCHGLIALTLSCGVPDQRSFFFPRMFLALAYNVSSSTLR
jgi:hypothetical protein